MKSSISNILGGAVLSLGLSTSSAFSEPTQKLVNCIGIEVNDLCIAKMQGDCFIGNRGNESILHCRKFESIGAFILENNLGGGWIRNPSILTLQGTTANRLILGLMQNGNPHGKLIYHQDGKFEFRENRKEKVTCIEMSKTVENKIVGIFDPNKTMVFSGTCDKVEGNGDISVNIKTVSIPGYSITLPQRYECIKTGPHYFCNGETPPISVGSYLTDYNKVTVTSGSGQPSISFMDVSTSFTIPESDL